MRISEKKTYKVSLSDKDGKFIGSSALTYRHTLYGLVSYAMQSTNRGYRAKFADIMCIDDDKLDSYKITSSGELKKV